MTDSSVADGSVNLNGTLGTAYCGQVAVTLYEDLALLSSVVANLARWQPLRHHLPPGLHLLPQPVQ